MESGTIVAENVSRRFRVYPQRHVTLKEAIVRRRQLRPVDVWALRDVSFRVEPGESVGFVSHSAPALERMCDRALLLRQGSVEYDGETGEAIRRYQQLLAGEENPA